MYLEIFFVRFLLLNFFRFQNLQAVAPCEEGVIAEISGHEGLLDENGVLRDIPLNAEDEEDEDGEEEEEIEYFNPEMAEVYRIISCDTPSCSHSFATSPSQIYPKVDPPNPEVDGNNESDMYDAPEPVDIEDHVQYLVKWRGLSYAECTWERWIDLKVCRPV